MATEGERLTPALKKQGQNKGKGKLFKARVTKRNTSDSEEVNHNDLSLLLSNKGHALQVFEQPHFEVEDFFQKHYKQLTEKDVEAARTDLETLLQFCNLELQRVVQKNYKLFLDACQGVAEMEEKVQMLRNQINGITSVVVDLKQAKAGVAKQAADKKAGDSGKRAKADPEKTQLTDLEQQLDQLFQSLDVAVAERDFQAVRELLGVGREVMVLLDEDQGELSRGVPDFISWKHQIEIKLAKRKQKMIKVVERILSEPTTSLPEVRSATRVLAHLVGKCHAASVMLHCHSQKIKQQQALLLKMHSSGGGDPDGTEYSGGLAQRTFVAVGRAADDVSSVFGGGCQEVQALFTVWATKETKQCASLLRRHALQAFNAPSGLMASVQCITLAMSFCSMVEHTHGLSLNGAFVGELVPHIEGVLKRHVRRWSDELKAHAGEEINNLALQCITHGATSAWWATGNGLTLITSGNMVTELKSMVETLQPLAGVRVAAAVRKALLELFSAMASAVGAGFSKYLQADKTYVEKLRPLAEAVMRHLGGLVEEALPAAVAPLDQFTTPISDVEQLDSLLDNVAQQCHLMP